MEAPCAAFLEEEEEEEDQEGAALAEALQNR